MIGIYAIFRKSDDKCMYVGQSECIERRIGQHLTNNTHIDVNSEEYYGKPIEIHNIDDKKYRIEREKFWIHELNPELNKYTDDYGWNKRKTSTFNGKHFADEEYSKYMLLEAEHPEFGIWYFTNTNQCAKVIGIGRTTLDYHIERSGKYNGWEFEWVDGSDVLYKFVNPSKEEVERDFDF